MKNNNFIGNVPKFVKERPTNAAIISKLNTNLDNRVDLLKNVSGVDKVTKFTKDKLINNDTILQLFPEIELSIQILTSSILSPNDMLTVNSIYSTNNIKLPSDVRSTLSSMVKEYVDKVYKLEDELPVILRESMFTKGSYASIIIPESTLDEIINEEEYSNYSLEDVEKHLLDKNEETYVGKSEKTNINVSLEGSDKTDTITMEALNEDMVITDNLKLLKLKDIKLKRLEDITYEKLGIESEDTSMFAEFFKPTYNAEKDGNRDDGEEVNTTLRIKSYDETIRDSVTQPLVMKLPVEAVVPVHVSGDPSKHLGYFIMLDNNGLPITITGGIKDDNRPKLYTGKKESSNGVLGKAASSLQKMSGKAPTLGDIEGVYGQILDSQLRNKLKNGIYSDIADMSEMTHIYRTMFNRTLKGKNTKMLFVPSALVSFYAFKYRPNGTGESLLETISTVASMRAILLFSRLMANIKNAITNTAIDVQLDEDDPDPEKTKEIIISEVLKNRQLDLPIGINTLDDLVDWSHSVGFKFNFKHVSLPDITIDTSYETTSIAAPDEELETNLKDYMVKAFGLSPEMVENGGEANFATTVVANNLLLAKRVNQLQNLLNPQLTDNVKKILKADAVARNLIKDILLGNLPAIKKQLKKQNEDNFNDIFKDNKNDSKLIDYLCDYYIDNILVTLPKPEMFQEDNMGEAFGKYKESIEDYVEMMLSSEALPDELIGDMADSVDSFKDMLVNTLLRKWSSDNNYLPDLHKMLTLDGEGKPMFNALDDFSAYKDNLTTVLISFLKKNKKFKDKLNDKLAKIEEGEEEEEEPTSTGDNEPVEGEPAEGDEPIEEGGEEEEEEVIEDGEEPTGDDEPEEEPIV